MRDLVKLSHSITIVMFFFWIPTFANNKRSKNQLQNKYDASRNANEEVLLLKLEWKDVLIWFVLVSCSWKVKIKPKSSQNMIFRSFFVKSYADGKTKCSAKSQNTHCTINFYCNLVRCRLTKTEWNIFESFCGSLLRNKSWYNTRTIYHNLDSLFGFLNESCVFFCWFFFAEMELFFWSWIFLELSSKPSRQKCIFQDRG